VQCQLDTLCELRDHRLSTIRKVLVALPETLSKTYQDILSRIPFSEDRETVVKILQFVAFSARPASVIELAEYAIIAEDARGSYDGEGFEDFESMLSLCGSLITVRDKHVLLAHESVKKFLTSRGLGLGLNTALSPEQEIHKMICGTCLDYMRLPTLTTGGAMEAGVISNYGRLEQVKTKYPFLDYACSSWPLHLAMAGPLIDREEADFSSALELHGRNNLWTAWLCLQRADIWDRQISLAVYLCESIILLPQHSSWSAGFWKERQLHRATRKPIRDFSGTNASFHDKDSVLVKYCPSSISFDPASQLSHPVCYHIALVLLEIALQQSLYTISVTDYSFGNHINFLKRLSHEAESRMGQAYAKAIEAALELCLEIQGTRGDVNWLVEQANERVIEPLRLASTVGFRASLSPGSTQWSHRRAFNRPVRSAYTAAPRRDNPSSLAWLYDTRRIGSAIPATAYAVSASSDIGVRAYGTRIIPSMEVTSTSTDQFANAPLVSHLALSDEEDFQLRPASHLPPLLPSPPQTFLDIPPPDQEVPLGKGPKHKSSFQVPVRSGIAPNQLTTAPFPPHVASPPVPKRVPTKDRPPRLTIEDASKWIRRKEGRASVAPLADKIFLNDLNRRDHVRHTIHN
jgi:hypothetical protein